MRPLTLTRQCAHITKMAPTIAAGSGPEPCSSPEPPAHDHVSVCASDNEDEISRSTANREVEDVQNLGGEKEEVSVTETDGKARVTRETNDEPKGNVQNQAEEEDNQSEEVSTTDHEKHIIDEGENNLKEVSSAKKRKRAIAADVKANVAPKANDDAEMNTEENRENGLISTSSQLPPPAWADVAYDQLVNYPKSSLRAQSYFDLQQIRAVKPITLITMGISVPAFPDLENDSVVLFSIKQTKHQLYYPTDVLLTKKNKSHLQKEVSSVG